MHTKILGFDIGIASIGWAFVENGELRDWCGYLPKQKIPKQEIL